jgi:exodeoxyribonuclease-3
LLCGDFNIAPEDRDVYNPLLWQGRVLFSEPEKTAG